MQAKRDNKSCHWLGLCALMLLVGCASGQDAAPAAISTPAAVPAQAAPSTTDDDLRAIDALVRAGDFTQAKALLEKVQTDGRDASLEQRKRLLGARIALAEHLPYVALNLLPTVPADIPPALQAQLIEVRAQAHEMAGNALENARERIRLDTLLTDAVEQRTNHRAIWAGLITLSPTALEQLRLAPPPDVLSGWMELATIARSAPETTALPGKIDAWQQRYPQHPASSDIVPGLLGEPEKTTSTAPSVGGYPSHLALLLPLDGQYVEQAKALRNGLLAAYYRHRWGGTAPQLRIYDTGTSDSGLRRYYDQAVKEGAGLVIGPLTKAAVADLAHSGDFTVPVLALNQVDGKVPAHFYQFALSPEDEARQAAERASLDSHTHAMAIVPAGDWGTHLLQAFTQRFQELGGGVTTVERYGVNSDFATVVQHLLGHYPEAPTQDADMIFMVAFPQQARQIVVQLATEQASALPVYATSHTYSGRGGSFDAAGLDGVIFCDIPWMLSPTSLSSSEYTRSASLWPDSMQANPRLYALGIDAYNIIPYLDRLGDSATTGYPGESGKLYLDNQHRLHRQLMWARYSGNTALPIDNAPLSQPPTPP